MKIAHFIVLILLSALLASCNLPAVAEVIAPSGPTATPFQPTIGAQDAEISAAKWWLAPNLPQGFIDSFVLPDGATRIDDSDQANVLLSVVSAPWAPTELEPFEGGIVSQWIYAVVAPFPTVTDEVSSEDVINVWNGDYTGSFSSPLLMSANTAAVFTAWIGQPPADTVRVVEDGASLLDAAWGSQPSWAIVPFEDIEPRWKVLNVDGQSPIWKDFEDKSYPLLVRIGLTGNTAAMADALSRFSADAESPIGAAGNRDADKLTTVVLTGVTALVRSTEWEMNRKGITYPAEDIGELLRAADILHISNEVPFAEDCPPPNPVQRELIFCSHPRDIELLEAVGTDIVELTGDHFNDWGSEAMLYTLHLYQDEGWPYYGGGANAEEARQPVRLEDHGNKIAFIGCNAKRGSYASARDDYPGAVACDYDLLEQQVNDLVTEGYVVIATFQHFEYYTFVPQPDLVADFGRISAAGASIVSGSQAHQTHGIEFPSPGAIITYGLGNLFFDQRGVVEFGDQALIARHVVYDGRYISTELFTIEFVDYAKPRFMTPEERTVFLTRVFDASRWERQ